jgi:hypothetical protein
MMKGYEPLRGNKYGAIRTEHNGRVFASKGEAKRAAELELRQQAGEISNLEYQVRYPLTVNGVVVGHYVADFKYIEDGQTVVEDVKSQPTMTPVYRLKKKLMSALLNIDIKEVGVK